MSLFKIPEFPHIGINPLNVISISWSKGYRLGNHPAHPKDKPGMFDGWCPAYVLVTTPDKSPYRIRCKSNREAATTAGSLQLQLDGLLDEFRQGDLI